LLSIHDHLVDISGSETLCALSGLVYRGDLIIRFLTLFSGLTKIIKHLGTNIQNNNPKLEAKMANISTATVNFPGELT
jgi:hypothetical protein